MLNKPEAPSEKREAVVIKKYANRRLYNTETSTYVTLEDLAAMVRSDRDFVVYDAKTGDDLTHSVLTQIIVEQEGRAGGQALLPIPFLRQLIRFYDDSIGKMVPTYLQFSLETLVKEQERFRAQFAHMFGKNPFGAAAFEAMQEQTRRNMAIFEQAMAMWSPFSSARSTSEPSTAQPQSGQRTSETEEKSGASGEIAELKAELARMQAKIERLSQKNG
ncbi:MAG TPA: polyhydroxyalkanoate synthesis repressor PhaR [Hyphomicrobiaceae bacterium]|nr:polyhydroxyalkanoate synthesis repressor PhaR [Hyphomicrobiaceae bacterium]